MPSPIDLRQLIREVVREEIAAMLRGGPADVQAANLGRDHPNDELAEFVDTFREPTPRRRPAQNYDLGFARSLVEAECIEDPLAETLHKDLYARYLILCEEHDTPPRTRTGLAKALGHLGYPLVRIGRETGRRGLRLRPR